MPHDVTILVAVFVTAFASNVSTPFLSLYRDRLDLNLTATQTIFVVYVIGIMVTLIGAGPLSDRIGRRAVIAPALLVSVLSSVLIIAGRDAYVLLLVGRCLLGASVGAVFSVGTAWVQDHLGPGHELRVAFGNTVATYAGFGLGPVVSAMFEYLVPNPLIVPFAVHIAAALAVAAAVMGVPEATGATAATPALNRTTERRSIPPEVRKLMATVVVPAAVWVFAFPSTSFALFPVLLSNQVEGFAAQMAGAAAALTALSGLMARPVLARLDPGPSMVVGMVAGTGGYLLGSAAFRFDLWWLVLPGAVLLGSASGTISAACLATLARTDAGDARGTVTSVFYLLTYPGMAVPLVVTTVATSASASVATVLSATTALAVVGTLVVAFTATGRRRGRPAT